MWRAARAQFTISGASATDLREFNARTFTLSASDDGGIASQFLTTTLPQLSPSQRAFSAPSDAHTSASMPLNSHDDICAGDGCWTPDICSNDGCWPGVYLIGAQSGHGVRLVAGKGALPRALPAERGHGRAAGGGGLDKLRPPRPAARSAARCTHGTARKFKRLWSTAILRLFLRPSARAAVPRPADLRTGSRRRMHGIVPTVLPQLRLIAVLRGRSPGPVVFNHVVGEGNSTSAQLSLSPLCDASCTGQRALRAGGSRRVCATLAPPTAR